MTKIDEIRKRAKNAKDHTFVAIEAGKCLAQDIPRLCEALEMAIAGIECVCSPHSEGAPAEWLKKKQEQFKAKIDRILSGGK